jgi:putative heme iron utilization protein
MADAFSPQVSDRICNHMNQDHAEAVLLYAKVFGQATTATAATMLSIDPMAMHLVAQINDTSTPIRIEFNHTLQDSEDAHHTLIDMVKQARQQVQSPA